MEHQNNEAAATEENGVAANQGNGGASNQNQLIAVYLTGKFSVGGVDQSGTEDLNKIDHQYSIGTIDKSAMKDLDQLELEVFRIALDDIPVLVPDKRIGVVEIKYMDANEQQLSAEEIEWSDFINKLIYVDLAAI